MKTPLVFVAIVSLAFPAMLAPSAVAGPLNPGSSLCAGGPQIAPLTFGIVPPDAFFSDHVTTPVDYVFASSPPLLLIVSVLIGNFDGCVVLCSLNGAGTCHVGEGTYSLWVSNPSGLPGSFVIERLCVSACINGG